MFPKFPIRSLALVRVRPVLSSFLLLGLVLSSSAWTQRADNSELSADPANVSVPISPQLTVDDLVTRMVQANADRARALQTYTGKRVYSLDYKGMWGRKQATLEVASKFIRPATKEFTIVSESGSKVLLNKVLKNLLDSEKDAANPENQRKTALTPENYKFTLLGTQTLPSGGCYRVAVDPLRDDKFLYQGEICIDARDFAVVKIEAQPAKNPSFWISGTKIEHAYEKIGQFWLPASNRSTSKVRLGGSAVLTIQYTDYKVN